MLNMDLTDETQEGGVVEGIPKAAKMADLGLEKSDSEIRSRT